MKSKLDKCQLIPRKHGDILFEIKKGGEVICDLFQYTIVPNEIFNDMQERLFQFETGTRKT